MKFFNEQSQTAGNLLKDLNIIADRVIFKKLTFDNVLSNA